METARIIWLLVQGAVFALWALAMFAALFRIWRLSEGNPLDSSGGPGAMLRRNLSAYARFPSDPAYAVDRRRLLVLTPLVLVLALGAVLLNPV